MPETLEPNTQDAEVVLLTTREVARIFKVDTSAVRRWVEKGRIRPHITTPGGQYRFNQADIDAFRASA